MGCAFPLQAIYTITDGSILTTDWCILAHAGIVFLGIGDSAAAVFGSQYGKTKWRERSGKTKEGSMYLTFSVIAVYLLIVLIVDPS